MTSGTICHLGVDKQAAAQAVIGDINRRGQPNKIAAAAKMFSCQSTTSAGASLGCKLLATQMQHGVGNVSISASKVRYCVEAAPDNAYASSKAVSFLLA